MTFKAFCAVIALVTAAVAVTDVNEARANGTREALRHQLRVDAANIFRFFSKDHVGYQQLYYTYRFRPETRFRAGFSGNLYAGQRTGFNTRLGLGLERIMRDEQKWTITNGFDLVGGLEKTRAVNRWTYETGIQVHMGFEYKVNPHFSISMEPGLLLLISYFKDHDTFAVNNSEVWFEAAVINTGRVLIGVRF